MLMKSMVAYNPEMIGDVYNNLAEQNFDLFEHIDKAMMAVEALIHLHLLHLLHMTLTWILLMIPGPMDPYYDPAATAYMDPTYESRPDGSIL